MARSAGKAPRSVVDDSSKMPRTTVKGAGDKGRPAVSKAQGADKDKQMPLKYRGTDTAGTAETGDVQKKIDGALKSGKTDM